MVTKPTQLRIPPELLARIDDRAQGEGITRTAWIVRACFLALGDPTPAEKAHPQNTECPPRTPAPTRAPAPIRSELHPRPPLGRQAGPLHREDVTPRFRDG
jgi:hypothetical protein